MVSKTKIGKRIAKKKDSQIVETIKEARKHKSWIKVASILSGPKRNYSAVNISDIDEHTKEGDTVLILGSVLGSGHIGKKVRVCALRFSAQASDKLKKTKSEIVTILEEIKKNPKAEGVKVLQ